MGLAILLIFCILFLSFILLSPHLMNFCFLELTNPFFNFYIFLIFHYIFILFSSIFIFRYHLLRVFLSVRLFFKISMLLLLFLCFYTLYFYFFFFTISFYNLYLICQTVLHIHLYYIYFLFVFSLLFVPCISFVMLPFSRTSLLLLR